MSATFFADVFTSLRPLRTAVPQLYSKLTASQELRKLLIDGLGIKSLTGKEWRNRHGPTPSLGPDTAELYGLNGVAVSSFD